MKVDLTNSEIQLLRDLVRLADMLGQGQHPEQDLLDSLAVKLEMVR